MSLHGFGDQVRLCALRYLPGTETPYVWEFKPGGQGQTDKDRHAESGMSVFVCLSAEKARLFPTAAQAGDREETAGNAQAGNHSDAAGFGNRVTDEMVGDRPGGSGYKAGLAG